LPQVLRTDWRALSAWLGGAALLIGLLWGGVQWRIATDQQRIRDQLRLAAATIAQTYAQQLGRAIAAIDLHMLRQKYRWEQSGATGGVPDQAPLPAPADMIVTIIDAAGNPVASTIPFKSNTFSIARRRHFLRHKAQPALGLTFEAPQIGLRLGRPVILMARRIDGAHGQFGGLVVVAIEPSYLAPSLGRDALRPGDLASAYRADGVLLAGDAPGAFGWHAVVPVGRAGSARGESAHYPDGQARVLAWRQVAGYPLVAAVGLVEDERMHAIESHQQALRKAALGASVLLVLAGAGGAGWRLWRSCRRARGRQPGAREQGADLDPLTGLPNRFWLMKHLPAALARARAADTRLAVLVIELENFKHLSQTHGHAVGDEVLRAAARRLAGLLGERDAMVRLGSDEFTMILQAPGDDDEIGALAARVRAVLGEPFEAGDGAHVLSGAVGVGVFPRDGADGAGLLRHADAALRQARGHRKA
jgi:diguanylate cyclase (GGDEF)-like protein